MHIDGHPCADAASGSAPASGRRLPYSTAKFVVAAIGVLDPLGGIVNNWASVDTAFRSAHAKSNRLLCSRQKQSTALHSTTTPAFAYAVASPDRPTVS